MPPDTTKPVYGWTAQVSKGAAGAAKLVAHLRREGRTVIDLSDLSDAQGRDIDLLVDDRYVEVKSDYHTPDTVFLELTCDHKPGCLFKSRADEWAYYFPLADVCLWLNLATLQWWAVEHAGDYVHRHVHSRRNGRTWVATGIVVPIGVLIDDGVGVLRSYTREDSQDE